MSTQLDWTLNFPIEDGLLLEDTLVVRSRGTSGAGQFEIAGSTHLQNGVILRARDVIGHKISFSFTSPVGTYPIRLADEYPVQEVGGKVRISVKRDDDTRPNIGNLFAALFLLPNVSQREKSIPFEENDLCEKTYWIDDVACRVVAQEEDLLILEPLQFVFATSNKDDSSQLSGMAYFDFRKRLKSIIEVAKFAANFSDGAAKTVLGYYFDALTGNIKFEYDLGSFLKATLMKWLEFQRADYKRTQDPLPALLDGIFSGNTTWIKRLKTELPFNLIYFGAPGTGKSYELNELAKANFADDHVRRVTFYPDYTYSQFVGCFKPMTEKVKEDDGRVTSDISYRYVPGPFLETYIDAVKNPEQNYLLIVEEINRANPAAVFGDVFQLLDRNKDGVSTYNVDASIEMRDRLEDELGIKVDKLRIPANMFIWATMNSADQGVFPMDTAFKRRWSFRYIGIDDGENTIIDGVKLSEKVVTCGGRKLRWNDLRKAINQLMIEDCNINEDKLLGPFFLDPSCLNDEQFADAFKDKVLMYLYEDAGKTKRSKLFWKSGVTYFDVCKQFDNHGEGVFGNGFRDHLIWKDELDSNDNDTQQGE